MLADTQLRSIKPQGKAYKIADDLGRYCSVMYLIELMLIGSSRNSVGEFA